MAKKNPSGHRTALRVEKAIEACSCTPEEFSERAAQKHGADVARTKRQFLGFREFGPRASRRRIPGCIIRLAEHELHARRRRTFRRTKDEDRAHRPSRALMQH